jgi:hypothetical protein
MKIGLLDIGIAFGCMAMLSIALDTLTGITAINSVNPDTPADRANAVNVSVSQGTLKWRGRSWNVVGSPHTPRGRFRISEARDGKEFMIPDSSHFLPFYALPIDQMPKTNPQYEAAQRSGAKITAWGIHSNNLRPGQIGGGCLLVHGANLPEMAQILPGATINITD